MSGSLLEVIRARVVNLCAAGKLLAKRLVVDIARPKVLTDRGSSQRGHGGDHLQTHFDLGGESLNHGRLLPLGVEIDLLIQP